VDPLDFDILRESVHDRVITWLWFDPRRSPETIAESLGVSPSTVRRHLYEWRRSGFLRGFHVLPNPDCLGVRSQYSVVDFAEASDLGRAIELLDSIDGMILEYEAPNQLVVHYAAETEVELSECADRMARIRGVTHSETVPLHIPACGRELSRLDWRMVQLLRENAVVSKSRLAQELGISSKTAGQHFESLIASHALAFHPEFGINRFPGTIMVLAALLSDPSQSERVAAEVLRVFPESIRNFGPGSAAPGEPSPAVLFLVAASTVAQLDDLSITVRALRGVSGTRLLSPQRLRHYPRWTDARINAIVTSGSSRHPEQGSLPIVASPANAPRRKLPRN